MAVMQTTELVIRANYQLVLILGNGACATWCFERSRLFLFVTSDLVARGAVQICSHTS